MRTKFGAVVLVLLSVGGGFVAGSWWYATMMVEPPPGPSEAPIALPPAPQPAPPPPSPRPQAQAPPSAPGSTKDDTRCAECTAALANTTTQLTTVRDELRLREEQRLAREGAPMPETLKPNEPRYAADKIRDAVSGALTQSGVPGRLQGLDCTEWPCIAYGRIR